MRFSSLRPGTTFSGGDDLLASSDAQIMKRAHFTESVAVNIDLLVGVEIVPARKCEPL